MIVNQFKVAILFYMVIVIQVQPEFSKDHHYRSYYKHAHDHNHAHHLKHQMEHNHEHHHKHPHDHDHDHHRRSKIRKASKIYNGVRTPPGQGNFMAVMVKSHRINHCSAVIITENMLLTAAHCIYNRSDTERALLRILPNALPIQNYRNNPFGRHRLIKRIRNFWIHPRYDPNSYPDLLYDIAIIQIHDRPRPWQLGEEIEAALMPVRIRHLDWSVIKGYGYGFDTSQTTPIYLNEVNFRYYISYVQENPVDSYVAFSVLNWSADRNQNPSIIRNAAKGDSGGGIFVKGSVYRFDRSTNRAIIRTGFVLVGIIIRVSPYTGSIADLNNPYYTIAVNVTRLMPWINSIVRVDFETYPFSRPTRRRIG